MRWRRRRVMTCDRILTMSEFTIRIKALTARVEMLEERVKLAEARKPWMATPSPPPGALIETKLD